MHGKKDHPKIILPVLVSFLLMFVPFNTHKAYAVTDTPTPTATYAVTPTPNATGIYDNSTLAGTVSCNSLHVDGGHPETCVLSSSSCVWNNTIKKLTCAGRWTAADTYPGRIQFIRPKVMLTGTNMTSGMSIGWRSAISSDAHYNVFNYCVDGSGDKGRTGLRGWGNGSLCFRQVAANDIPLPPATSLESWVGPLSGSFTFEFDLYPTYLTPTITPTATSASTPTATATFTPTDTPTATATNTSTPAPTDTPLPTNTPAPNSALTNAYRFAVESNSGAYSAIVTGDPTLRSNPTGQWSYMRVAAQRIINGNVYFVEIGWLKGAQVESNFIPRDYWAYRDINGDKNKGWEGYPGIGLAYNYRVMRTSSETWSLYFNDLTTPDQTIWLGWDNADRIFSGGEVPNGSQGMGDSNNNNVQYLDPTGANWFPACSTTLFNEDSSKYSVYAGGNCSSWRVDGNN